MRNINKIHLAVEAFDSKQIEFAVSPVTGEAELRLISIAGVLSESKTNSVGDIQYRLKQLCNIEVKIESVGSITAENVNLSIHVRIEKETSPGSKEFEGKLIRGTVSLDITDNKDAWKDLWPFHESGLTAIRLDPSGLHVQGNLPKCFENEHFKNVGVVLRCPKPKDDAKWCLSSQPLRINQNDDARNSITIVNKTISQLQTSGNVFVDNVECNPTDECKVWFYHADTGKTQVEWYAENIGTRISIASGTEKDRSSETSFFPSQLVGRTFRESGKAVSAWQLSTVDRKTKKYRWRDPKDTLQKWFVKLSSDPMEFRIESMPMVCHEAPLLRRASKTADLQEIWCCTQEGWLSFSGKDGKPLVDDSVRFEQSNNVGLRGTVDILELVNRLDQKDNVFPEATALYLGADDQTDIVLEFNAESATLWIDQPTCILRTDRVFAYAPEPKFDPEKSDNVGSMPLDPFVLASPHSLPSLIWGSGIELQPGTFVLQRHAQAKTQGGGQSKSWDKDQYLTANVVVDTKTATLQMSLKAPTIIGWTDSQYPIARSFPDPQALRRNNPGTKPDTKNVKVLDENRSLHPTRLKQGKACNIVFRGLLLPAIEPPTALPAFPKLDAGDWTPIKEFEPTRSFLTTLPGIEFQYPSKNGDGTAKWSYRYANPAMDEAYAQVTEDSSQVAEAYIFQLDGPDTTRVQHATAFQQGDDKAKHFLPVMNGNPYGSIKLGPISEDFSTPNVVVELGEDGKETRLQRPTLELRFADTLPSHPFKAFDKNYSVVGHGQPLLIEHRVNNSFTVHDALGSTISTPSKVKGLSQTTNSKMDKTRITGTIELTVGESKLSLELVGIHSGTTPTKMSEASISLERWMLHGLNHELPKLWGFPFIPTRLDSVSDTLEEIKISGVWLPCHPPTEQDKLSELLLGAGEITLTFESNQLTQIQGAIDWRFHAFVSDEASLSRILANVTLEAGMPKFAVQEVASMTPCGLVRMTELKETSAKLVLHPSSEKSEAPYLSLSITKWSPWPNGDSQGQPNTKHSFGPVFIEPENQSVALTPYDFRWITANEKSDGGEIYESTLAYGITPELRESDLKRLLGDASTQSLSFPATKWMTWLFGDKEGEEIASSLRNLSQATSDNKARQRLFGEKLIDQINQWISEGKIPVALKSTPSTDNIDYAQLPTLNSSSEFKPYCFALSDAASNPRFADNSHLFIANRLAHYDGQNSALSKNPAMQDWASIPTTDSEEFDQFVRLNGSKVAELVPNKGWLQRPQSPTYALKAKHLKDLGDHFVASFQVSLPTPTSGASFTIRFQGASSVKVTMDSSGTATVGDQNANVKVNESNTFSFCKNEGSWLVFVNDVPCNVSIQNEVSQQNVNWTVESGELVVEAVSIWNLTKFPPPQTENADSNRHVAIESQVIANIVNGSPPMMRQLHAYALTEKFARCVLYAEKTTEGKAIEVRWLRRHLIDALFKAMIPGQESIESSNWESYWHASTSSREGTGAQQPLLGDVILKPIQITAKEVLFEFTRHIYLGEEDRKRLNSHLKLEPRGGYFGAEVHWRVSDEDKSFLHFSKNAFQLLLHITDRQRRDAIAIWTPPEKTNDSHFNESKRDQFIDRLHIREDSIGEIQAMEGLCSQRSTLHELGLIFLSPTGRFYRWQPHGKSCCERFLTLEPKWPNIENSGTAKPPLFRDFALRSQDVDALSCVLVDDLSNAISSVNQAVTQIPRATLPFVRFVASEVLFNNDEGILIQRGNQDTFVIERISKASIYRQKKSLARSGTFLAARRAIWIDSNNCYYVSDITSNEDARNWPFEAKALGLVGPNSAHLVVLSNDKPFPAIQLVKDVDPAQIQAQMQPPRTVLKGLDRDCDSLTSLGSTLILHQTRLQVAHVDLINLGISSSSFELNLGDLAFLEGSLRTVKRHLGSSNDHHLILRGTGSQTNCLGVLSNSVAGGMKLRLTGKLVLQNDVNFFEKKKFTGEETDCECTHRIDMYVDQAELPIEVMFRGPKKDVFVPSIVQHVFRFSDGKERRWQCPQMVRFSTMGRMKHLMGLTDLVESDERLVVDASNAMVLKRKTTQRSTDSATSGSGVLRNPLLEITLSPEVRTRFDHLKEHDGDKNSKELEQRFDTNPRIVRLPFFASTAFKSKIVGEVDEGKVERPKIELTKDGESFSFGQVGAQNFQPLLSQYHESLPTSSASIDFFSRNTMATWLDSSFLKWCVTQKSAKVLSPLLNDDKFAWNNSKLGDLQKLSEDPALTPMESGVYQGNRITYSAATLIGDFENHPTLLQVPFSASIQAPKDPLGLSALWDRKSIDVQLVVFTGGEFRKIAEKTFTTEDILKVETKETSSAGENLLADEMLREKMQQDLLKQVHNQSQSWAKGELKRHRRKSSAFLIVDFGAVIPLSAEPGLGNAFLPRIANEKSAASDWPVAHSLESIGQVDPRCRLPLGGMRLQAKKDSGFLPFEAKPCSVNGEKGLEPAPVSSTLWRLIRTDDDFNGSLKVASRLTDSTTVPTFTWNDSIPFDVYNREFPTPHQWHAERGAKDEAPETDLTQVLIEVPRFEINSWSARPGEMTANSFRYEHNGTDSKVGASAAHSLTLRRARAVAAPGEWVKLEKVGEQSEKTEQPKPTHPGLVIQRLRVCQQMAESISPTKPNEFLFALVTNEKLVFGGKTDPAIAILPKGTSFKLIAVGKDLANDHLIRIDFVDQHRELDSLSATDFGNTEDYRVLTSRNDGHVHEFEYTSELSAQLGDKNTARLIVFKENKDSSNNTTYSAESYTKIELQFVPNDTLFKAPSQALAVLTNEAKIQSPQRLVGYGHLNAEDFLLIEPLLRGGNKISWRRSAEFSVCHRKRSREVSYDYDIVVTGPAGQTIPTV